MFSNIVAEPREIFPSSAGYHRVILKFVAWPNSDTQLSWPKIRIWTGRKIEDDAILAYSFYRTFTRPLSNLHLSHKLIFAPRSIFY